VREPFLVCWKRHTPLVHKIWVREIFFIILIILSTQRSYIYKKPDTNRCFPKLRAISNLFSFFLYTLYNKQKNTWVLGNTRFISRVEHDISLVRCAHLWDIMSNTRNKSGIFAHPCIILYIYMHAGHEMTIKNSYFKAILNNIHHNFLWIGN
jgi:hypothetical protein